MTPMQRAMSVRFVGLVAMLCGLCGAEFLGLHALGMVMSIVGLCALSAGAALTYSAWENGE